MRWLVLVLIFAVFDDHMAAAPSPSPRRDINAVLADHDEALLAIKGVVGVYVGLLGDKSTPCLRVMVIQDFPAVRKEIPSSIEGYPVVIEASGKIRPLERS